MTSRPPTRALGDVLRLRSTAALQRATCELSNVVRTLPADMLQTRFLRNAALVSPSSLCLLPAHTDTATTSSSPSSSSRAVEAALVPWGLFALYKPPFCPMRAAEATDNYHRVSVESYVQSMLRTHPTWLSRRRRASSATPLSRPHNTATTATAAATAATADVRVLNDLDRFASGPVLVHLRTCASSSPPSAAHRAVTSLANYTMEYDVLVAGHLPAHATGTVDASLLFPTRPDSTRDSSNSNTSTTTTTCTYSVRRTAYYAAHAVTLLTLRIVAPPSWRAPCIDAYVRQHLGTFVLGDPYATPLLYGATTAATSCKQHEHDEAHSSDAAATRLASVGTMAMQGDCDFPRVFTHLRQVHVTLPRCDDDDDDDVAAMTTRAATASTVVVRFACPGCFDRLLQPSRATTSKARALSVVDGAWSPDMHT